MNTDKFRESILGCFDRQLEKQRQYSNMLNKEMIQQPIPQAPVEAQQEMQQLSQEIGIQQQNQQQPQVASQVAHGGKKQKSQSPKAAINFNTNGNGEATVETISSVGRREIQEQNPAASVLPFGINVVPESLVPTVGTDIITPQAIPQQYSPNVNPALISGAISMIPRDPKIRMDSPETIPHDPNMNPIITPDFANLYPESMQIQQPTHEEEHAVMDITAGVLEKYNGLNSNVNLQNVIDLIGKHNLRFQFAEENGIIYVMVGDGSTITPDPTISFSIDAGKNILNGKAKWFPCIMPVAGYGYEDYPIFELDCSNEGALSLYLQKKLPDSFRTIVGPEQLELNKFVDVNNCCYMDNQKRPAIMKRLKDAMKKGIFNQDKAGMFGTRYRISEVTSASTFKLINDAPYRYGFPVNPPAQLVEITFEENNKAHWKTIQ